MQKPAGWAAGPWRAVAIAVMAAAAVALGGAHEALAVTVDPSQGAEEIRHAIGNETDGNTVTFAAGTYPNLGNVAIISDVTLEPAAGADVTLTGRVSFNILSDGVTIRGLTFHNTESPGTEPSYIGHTNSRRTGVIVLGYDAARFPVMSAADAGTSLDSIEIRNNTITNTNWHGILFRPYNQLETNAVTYSNIVIAENAISDIGVRGNGGPSRNLAGAIHGNEYRAIPAAITGLDISNNVITNPKYAGIVVANAGGSITGNTISRPAPTGIGVHLDADGLTVTGNTITGPGPNSATTGIAVAALAENTRISGNEVTRVRTGLLFCGDGGSDDYGCDGDVAAVPTTLDVTENVFTDVLVGASNNNNRLEFRAEGNYFESGTGEVRVSQFTDVIPFYTNEALGPAYLTQSADVSESPGTAVPYSGDIHDEGAGSATNLTRSVGLDSSLRGLVLHVNMSHANVNDVMVGLEAPDGTYVLLGDHQAVLQGVIPTFADPERLRFSTFNYDTLGDQFLDGQLHALYGTPTAGDWKLVLGDRRDNNVNGTLNSWSLSLATDPDLSNLIFASSDEHSTGQGAAAVIPVLENDQIPDGVNANVTVVAQPPNGEARVNSAPGAGDTITYEPDDDFAGLDTFTYRVEDEDGSRFDEATVTVTVGAFYLRDIPDQAADELAPFSYRIPHENPGGAALTWRIASSPADLANDGDGDPEVAAGTFTWTPSEEDGDGTQREFVIEASAAGESHSKALRVTANEVNSPPAFRESLDASYVAAQGVPFTLDVTADDPDRPAQDLRYRITGLSPLPALNNDTSQGGITVAQSEAVEMAWVPENPGTFDLEIRVDDGVAPAVIHAAQVVVPVYPADINTTSIDDDTITVETTGRYYSAYDVRVLDPGGAPVHSYTVPGNAPYTSDPVDLDPGIYTIQADVAGGADKWGRDSTVTTVFVHPDNHRTEYVNSVSAGNLPSVIREKSHDVSISLDRRLPRLFNLTSPELPAAKIEPGESVNIDAAAPVTTDPDGLPFTIEVTSVPTGASAEVFPNNTIRYTTGATQRADDIIGYEVRVGSEVVDAANATVRVVVFEAPDIVISRAPNALVRMNILEYLPNGTILEFPDLPAPNSEGGIPHENGTLTIEEHGVRFVQVALDYRGTSRLNYSLTHSGATETGTITIHLLLPVVDSKALSDIYFTERDGIFSIDANNTRLDVWRPDEIGWVTEVIDGSPVKATGFDVDGDGIVTWAASDVRWQLINVTAVLPGVDSPDYATAEITVIPYRDVRIEDQRADDTGNRMPVMHDVKVDNPDDVPLVWSLAEQRYDEEIDNATGVFTWTPNATHDDDFHEFRVKYEVRNATVPSAPFDTETATLRVLVGEENRPPALAMIGDRSVTEDGTLEIVPLAPDPDGDAVTWGLDRGTLPAAATFDRTTGRITWDMPGDDYGGMSYTVNITASDGIKDPVYETITIRVVEIAGDSVQDTAEDMPIRFPPDILAPGANVTLQVTNGTRGTAVTNGTDIIYRPNPDQNGMDEITYTMVYAADGASTESNGTITINIAPANDSPTLVTSGNTRVSDTRYTVPEGGNLTVSVTAMDPADEAPSVISLVNRGGLPDDAVWDEAGDVLTWVGPGEDQGGKSYTMTVMADDGEHRPNFDITISVVESNELPMFADVGELRAFVGVPFTLDLSATDADLPAQALTYSIESENATGDVTIGADDGIISWTPEVVEAAEVVVQVTDNFTDPGTSSVTLRIEQPAFELSAGEAVFAPDPEWGRISTATQYLRASGSCGGVMGVIASAGPWGGVQGAAGITTSVMVANSTRSGFVELGSALEVFELQTPVRSPGGQIEVTLRADLPPAPAGLSDASRPMQDIEYVAFCY